MQLIILRFIIIISILQKRNLKQRELEAEPKVWELFSVRSGEAPT